MKKTLMIMLALVLVIAMSVTGTLAYLTSQDSVTNTFTVGKVVITLDEAKVDVYGVEEAGAARVKANTYKLIPGHEYVKDPIVHVDPASEDSYVFVEIANGIEVIDAEIVAQIQDNGWTLLEGDVYYKVVLAADTDKELEVFESFTFPGNANPENYENATIEVTAYAVQKDTFTTAEAAWNATFGAQA